MQSIFSFCENIKPVSVNQAVRHGRNGSYKSQAYKDFWNEISKLLEDYVKPTINESDSFEMAITFTMPVDEFYTKKGLIAKKHDLDNLQKYTIDAIAKHCGFNDASICKLITKKIPGAEWEIYAHLMRIKTDATNKRQLFETLNSAIYPITSDSSGLLESIESEL